MSKDALENERILKFVDTNLRPEKYGFNWGRKNKNIDDFVNFEVKPRDILEAILNKSKCFYHI